MPRLYRIILIANAENALLTLLFDRNEEKHRLQIDYHLKGVNLINIYSLSISVPERLALWG